MVDKAAKTGRLTVGVRDFLPGIALNDNGDWKGFEIDLAVEVARALGVPRDGVTFRATSREERPRLLSTGDLDLVLATYPINDEDGVTFAGPYYLAHVDVLVRGDSPIAAAKDLEGRRVCRHREHLGGRPAGRGGPAHAGSRPDLLRVHGQAAERRGRRGSRGRPAAGRVRRPGERPLQGARPEAHRRALRGGRQEGRRAHLRGRAGAIAALYKDGTIARLLDEHFSKVEFATRENGLPAMAPCA
ncbi:transporter substrate-binding domain-containing protein [Streptosporangium lutulentum]